MTHWHGMPLIVDRRVPPGGYIITDDRGSILSGGNIDTGKHWVRRQGDPARVYVTETVADKLTEDEVTSKETLH